VSVDYLNSIEGERSDEKLSSVIKATADLDLDVING